MRFISLLIGLAIIGYLLTQQLSSKNSEPSNAVNIEGVNTQAPKVPTTVEEVPKFEKDMDDFMKKAAAERDKKMRELEGDTSDDD